MLTPASYEVSLGLVAGRLPAIVLVLANLFPLYAVIAGYWDVGSLLILYWSENLILGFYSLLKILLAGFRSPLTILFNSFTACFFLVHYGGFVGVHGIFVIHFFPLPGEPFSMAGMHWPLLLVFPEILMRVSTYMFQQMPELMFSGFLLLFASHGVSFIVNYLLRGEFRDSNSGREMASPYGRIIVMHITILLGAFAVELLGSNLAFVVILVGLKILLDLGLHLRSHRGSKNDQAKQ